MKFKYIIVEINQMELPVIFSPLLAHEEVSVHRMQKVISAGYCELDSAGRWITNGQSISLKIKARPEDADILNAQPEPPHMLARLVKFHTKS